MSNKDLAGDRKWAALQKTVATSIDKMVAGTVSPVDVKALSSVIAQQHALAGTLFEAGVADLQRRTQSVVDQEQKQRVDLGKPALASKELQQLFDERFQEVMSTQSQSIVSAIRDMLAQQQRENTMDQAFEKARADQQEAKENQPSVVSLTKRVRELANQVEASNEKEDGGQAEKRPTLTSQQAKPKARRSLVNRVTQMLGQRGTSLSEMMQRHGVQRGADIVAEGTKAKSTDAQIQQALEDNSVLRKRARTAWDRQDQNIGVGADQAQEDKRNNSWLRKLKALMGGKRKGQDKPEESSSIWSMLAKTLMLALLHPQLLKTIGEQVSKYLNFDSISSFIASTWTDIKDGGAKIYDWVVDKIKGFFTPNAKKGLAADNSQRATIAGDLVKASAIPADVTAADAARKIPELEKRLARARTTLAKAKDTAAKDPSDRNKVYVSHAMQNIAILENQLDGYRARVRGTTVDQARIKQRAETTAATVPGQEPATEGTKAAAATTSTSVSSAPITPADPAGVAKSTLPETSTKTVIEDMPRFMDGKTIDDDAAADDASDGGGSTSSTFSPVSLNSFGFTSGDDQMNLLNMDLIS